jgi:hypothetical protein
VTLVHPIYVLAALCISAGCADEAFQDNNTQSTVHDAPNTPYPAVGELPPPGFVDYFLHWQLRNLVTQENRWVTESNIGYEVTIESGWLSNYRITLAACPSTGFLNLMGHLMPSAYANDGGSVDESESTSGVAEDLVKLQNQKWIRRPLQDHDYCRLHHLIARADETVLMRPTAIDLNRTTLMIKGTAVKNNVVTPFEVSSAFAHGGLYALNELLMMYHSKTNLSGTERIQVVIERNPSQWFDDVDFEALPDRQLGHMIGSQIMSTTVYHVKATD